MARRRDVFYKGGYYHIYNKTLNKIKIFNEKKICGRFLETLSFYKLEVSLSMRFSLFLEKSEWDKTVILSNEGKICEILAYCLMPNHYHLVIKQVGTDSVSSFMGHVMDSLTKYYNFSTNRSGPLFYPRFKSKAILSNEQLIHTARYIHLNPYSSSLITSFEALRSFQYSSYRAYLSGQDSYGVVDKEELSKYFAIEKGTSKFLEFTESQAEWQKTLEYVKNPNKWS